MKFGFQDISHKIENMRDELNAKMDNTLNKMEAMRGKIGTQLFMRGFFWRNTPYTPHISVAGS